MRAAGVEIRNMFSGGFNKSIEERTRKLMAHPHMKAFIEENPDVPFSVYKKSLFKLDQFVRERENCVNCKGLETCGNRNPGVYTDLVAYEMGGVCMIETKSVGCPRLEAFEQAKKRSALMQTHMIPKSVASATFQTIDVDPYRAPVIEELMKYLTLFEDGNLPKQGLYLYGSFGVGKSHLAAALANYLSALGIDSFMVYVPDFVQSMYNSLQKGTTHELVDAVKKTKVLILDDIGANSLNPWMRDEILGTILQHRMAEELPTIYTSNLTLDELQNHLAFTTKGGEERIKAARIMERIRHNVRALEVRGKNRREAF